MAHRIFDCCSEYFHIQVAVAFQLVLLIMGLITFWKPLKEPKRLPVRKEMDVRTEPKVIYIGAAVVISIITFYIIFW